MTANLESSPLVAVLANIPDTNLVPAKFLSGGSIGAKIAYGKEASIMLATRQPQYHSKPHSHEFRAVKLCARRRTLCLRRR